jgi:glutamine---fructose-6-phosphate transaminase (isomerizing)
VHEFDASTKLMTHFLQDILRQPAELQRALDYLSGPGSRALQSAVGEIKKAEHVYLTGIGSSWHASLSVAPIFQRSAHPVFLEEASELLEFAMLPAGSVVITISRSGKSIEIVHLLEKARRSGATVIGITNSADGTLAQQAQISIIVPTPLDHAISVNTYSSLALAAGVLASSVAGCCSDDLKASLRNAIVETERRIPAWQEQIRESSWLRSRKPTYFLARGGSMGSCNETRLLWEEGTKSPATALGTGGFRHGPQEMATVETRFGMWIDGERMRAQDLSVAADLRRLGASVMLIGQDLPADAAELIFQLPEIPADWQFLIDIVPAQLVAEALSRYLKVDCDSFRLCSFIVEDDFGLGTEVGR